MVAPPPSDPELLVTQGGVLHQGLRRAGFHTPTPRDATRAAVVLAAAAWLPLLVLSLVAAPEGATVSIPLIADFSTAIRFLLTLPLLVFADSVIEPRLAMVARHFTAGELIPVEERPRYLRAIEQALAWRDARLPQFLIAGLALGLSLFGVTNAVSSELSSWHAVPTAAGPTLTRAGMVYDFFSLPLYRFVIATWLWRYLIWILFLWRASRLRLHIVPSHPDMAGGLGFIGVGQAGFAILMATFSTTLASGIGMLVVHGPGRLESFHSLIGVYLVLMLLLFLGPLLVFSPALFRAKRQGLFRYSLLGEEYVTAFESRWMGRRDPAGEPLLGSADIQSLADLAGSYDIVQRMRVYPFSRRLVIALGAAAAAPLLPLALLEYPITEILSRVLGLLL